LELWAAATATSAGLISLTAGKAAAEHHGKDDHDAAHEHSSQAKA